MLDVFGGMLQGFVFFVHRVLTTRTGGVRQPTATPLENLLQDFILNLGVGWGNANPVGGNMWFLGNPGDYAWGHEGLDAIVTQLLNQMDGSGKLISTRYETVFFLK